MSSTEPSSRRPATKAGNTGAPVGSTLSIVLAVAAVVAGFFILKNINDGTTKTVVGTSTNTVAPSTDSTTVTTAVSVAIPVTPTTIAMVTTGATVVVANASNVDGSAKQMTEALSKANFTMGSPTNAGGAEVLLTTSKVYYAATPEAQAVARSAAHAMGDVSVEPMPTPTPTKDGSIGDGTVLVMLGTDLAGKPLPLFAEPAAAATASPAAAPLETTTTVAG